MYCASGRSKTSSTALERLMSMPLAKLDRLLGYGAVFAVVGAVAFGPLGLETGGAVWAVVLIAVANAVLGVSLGLFLSAFATSEFQAVQFMPAVVFPQSLLCGPLVPREQLPEVLEVVSAFLPLAYAYDALANITPRSGFDSRVCRSGRRRRLVLALVAGALTLRRRTP